MSNKVLFELASAAVYDSTGILPIPSVITNMESAMANTPPDEARKAKRKFRKMWRKLAREASSRALYSAEIIENIYGVNAAEPTREQKRARKGLVRRAMCKAAWAMVTDMKNPDKSQK